MTVETITESGELAAPAAVPALPMPLGGSSMNNADVLLWVERFELYHRIAQGLAESDFIPKSMKPNMPPGATRASHPAEFAKIDANATAAMMAGSGYNFGPLASLQNMHVINGVVGMSAAIKHAIAEAAGHEMEEIERSYEAVTWRGRRKNWPDTRKDVVIRITRQEAIDAGWAKGKDTYDKVPADMLAARCKARVADRIIPELLHGIVTLEDVRDLPAEAPVAGTTTVTASDIRARATAAQPQLDHSVAVNAAARVEQQLTEPSPAATGETVAETGEGITLAQRKTLGGWLRKLDLGEPADLPAALAVISHFVRRPIGAPGDLLQSEAAPLMAKLKELAAKDEPDWRDSIMHIVNLPAEGGQLPMPEGGDR